MKEGHAEKKMFSNGISRSSKVNQGQLGLLSFFVFQFAINMAKNDENMKILYKDMPIYALNFPIWDHLARQCTSLIKCEQCSKRKSYKERHQRRLTKAMVPGTTTCKY